MDEITLGGKTYISAKRAAKETGYDKDYIGQLCRSGKLSAKKVGRNWYIEKEEVQTHHKSTLARKSVVASEREVYREKEQEQETEEEVIPKIEERKEEPEKNQDTSEERQGESDENVRVSHVQIEKNAPGDVVQSILAARMKDSKVPAAETSPAQQPSRFQTRVVEEAFPMHYEVEEGPLIPTPVRRERTTIDLGKSFDKKSEGESVQQLQIKHSKASISVQRPSSYVADARAVRMQRFGPAASAKAAVPVKQRLVPDEAEVRALQKEAKEINSDEQDTLINKNFLSKGALFFVLIAVVIIAAALYTSLVIQDQRSYQRDESGSYQLRSHFLDWF